ncbi:MAG: hypothetical protein IRY91_15290 [Gemmatimonadaceae bacterium]|nr:hypothetical protein [Gemmatimonadaceae bacterium]
MSPIALRPRSPTEIVDASLRLVRQYYPQLTALTLVALLPYVALLLLVRDAMTNPFTVFPMVIVQVLSTTVAEAATIVTVSDGYLTGEVRIGTALATTVQRVLTLIGAAFARWIFLFGVGILIMLIPAGLGATIFRGAMAPVGILLGVLLAGVPFVYLVLRTFATTAAVMIEKRGPIDSVQRSWALAEGRVGGIFVALLITWLIYFAVFILFRVALMAVPGASTNVALMGVLTAVVLAFVYPLVGAVTTLLYYDLRVRREGFDLEVMARDLGVAEPTAP